MRVLFVHGMGRTPISGWPLPAAVAAAGLEVRLVPRQGHLGGEGRGVHRLDCQMAW